LRCERQAGCCPAVWRTRWISEFGPSSRWFGGTVHLVGCFVERCLFDRIAGARRRRPPSKSSATCDLRPATPSLVDWNFSPTVLTFHSTDANVTFLTATRNTSTVRTVGTLLSSTYRTCCLLAPRTTRTTFAPLLPSFAHIGSVCGFAPTPSGRNGVTKGKPQQVQRRCWRTASTMIPCRHLCRDAKTASPYQAIQSSALETHDGRHTPS
jgi:hypothetical protein